MKASTKLPVEAKLTLTFSSLTAIVPRSWCDGDGAVDPDKAAKHIDWHLDAEGQLVIVLKPAFKVEEINLNQIEVEVEGERTFFDDEEAGDGE